MVGRVPDTAHMTSERAILMEHLHNGQNLVAPVSIVPGETRRNPVGEEILGLYRPHSATKAVIADMTLLNSFEEAGLNAPSFLEAGPRELLKFDPHRVRAAIVTTGGLAPGLNGVIHGIVHRHVNTYSLDRAHGAVLGVFNGFQGLCRLADSHVDLTPDTTEEWLDHGGSRLGNVRYFPEHRTLDQTVEIITRNLRVNNIDILYVIGGDGSLKVAHRIAEADRTRAVVGIPKTMDNDILWVWQSFGFNTAVEQATRVINILSQEAESTRRICVIELFGAESGFVAANAAMASGHLDLVLIPEVFKALTPEQARDYLDAVIEHVRQRVQRQPRTPHAVIVVAEGVGTVLQEKGVTVVGAPVVKDGFVDVLKDLLHERVLDAYGEKVPVFDNRPRHYIRAVPANAHDRIYCDRLGALAVDNALAGYTDFMISQWLAEFVLVPLSLVGQGKKSIPINGMFWKQVISSTGQPLSPAEWPTASAEPHYRPASAAEPSEVREGNEAETAAG